MSQGGLPSRDQSSGRETVRRSRGPRVEGEGHEAMRTNQEDPPHFPPHQTLGIGEAADPSLCTSEPHPGAQSRCHRDALVPSSWNSTLSPARLPGDICPRGVPSRRPRPDDLGTEIHPGAIGNKLLFHPVCRETPTAQNWVKNRNGRLCSKSHSAKEAATRSRLSRPETGSVIKKI